LIYYSNWKSEDAARSFARVYESELPRKYKSITQRTADAKSTDEQVYTTPEGDVLVQIVENGVFVSEGFDLDLARKLSDSIVSAQATGPIQQAQMPDKELTLGFAQSLASLGVPRAGLLSTAANTSTAH